MVFSADFVLCRIQLEAVFDDFSDKAREPRLFPLLTNSVEGCSFDVEYNSSIVSTQDNVRITGYDLEEDRLTSGLSSKKPLKKYKGGV